MKKSKEFRREPLTDTQLLMTITICIFFGMYLLAMLLFGGGFLHAQQVFDMLNDYASLIIVACGLTVVMIGKGIDISVGAVTSLVVMSCVLYLNKGGSIFVSVLLALGIGLAFGVVQGFLVSYLEIQPFIVTLAGMFFARGMTTILSVNPQKVAHEGFAKLRDVKIVIPWLGYTAKNGNLVPARVELGVVVALCCLIAVFLLLKFHKLGRAFYAIGGTLLTGGVGNVIGTFFGTLTLTTIKKIVVSSGLNDPWWQSITTGGMLCFFILLQSVVLSQRAKRKKA